MQWAKGYNCGVVTKSYISAQISGVQTVNACYNLCKPFGGD